MSRTHLHIFPTCFASMVQLIQISKCMYFIGNMLNVFKLIQNLNIAFEICANVYGSPMDHYKDPNNVNISFEICVNVFQLIQNVKILFEICAHVSGI